VGDAVAVGDAAAVGCPGSSSSQPDAARKMITSAAFLSTFLRIELVAPRIHLARRPPRAAHGSVGQLYASLEQRRGCKKCLDTKRYSILSGDDHLWVA
jgi:hypothetical protein